jgi:hypothetical protein
LYPFTFPSANYVLFLEPYNKFSALLAKKICYLRLLSSSAGLGHKTVPILALELHGNWQEKMLK